MIPAELFAAAAKAVAQAEQEYRDDCQLVTDLLTAARIAYEAGDRATAGHSLTEAHNVAHSQGINLGDMFEPLGLRDGAEP